MASLGNLSVVGKLSAELKLRTESMRDRGSKPAQISSKSSYLSACTSCSRYNWRSWPIQPHFHIKHRRLDMIRPLIRFPPVSSPSIQFASPSFLPSLPIDPITTGVINSQSCHIDAMNPNRSIRIPEKQKKSFGLTNQVGRNADWKTVDISVLFDRLLPSPSHFHLCERS